VGGASVTSAGVRGTMDMSQLKSMAKDGLAAAKKGAAAASEAAAPALAVASAAAAPVLATMREGVLSAGEEVAKIAPSLKPGFEDAAVAAGGDVSGFLETPTGQYLSEHPEAMAPLIAVMVAVGVPGAGLLSTAMGVLGATTAMVPYVMMLAGPLSGAPGSEMELVKMALQAQGLPVPP